MIPLQRFLLLLSLLVGIWGAAGCSSDIKEIDRMNYAIAIGADFKEGKHYAYVQFLDLSSVAKTTEASRKSSTTYVTQGQGSTFEQALFTIYQTAQERTIWSHVTSIVFSEAALKQSLSNVYESISRYSEFRFTPWVYGTTEPIKEIMSIGGLYGQSPLSTLLHEPNSLYTQTSLVRPVRLHEFVRAITEPGYTACIPTLAINSKQLKENREPLPLLSIEGAMFLKQGKLQSHVPVSKLQGLRWVQRGTERAAISVPNVPHPSVELVVERPSAHFKLRTEDGKAQVDAEIRATGYMTSMTSSDLANLADLTRESEKTIRDEIMEVYKLGREQHTDILNLEHELFKKNAPLWRSLAASAPPPLKEISLHDVNVSVNITHSGTSKNERINSLP
ncbi:Ger(x)C family spore germination protein [Paenibacillus silviterrae]|uniref:Ger(x)C family spore germination protein n=1 Tax=Paenibacillus silviterrae TaxID=3242194 RepID=UPI00254382AB|nr:Ger(x)C family spore germination protein [Paenibacillus chinjuensis]